MKRSWMASTDTTASIAPAAPSVWPIIDLVELTGRVAARSPNTVLIARVSIGSLAGVAVPWALM